MSPCSTVPLTNQGCPSRSAASATRALGQGGPDGARGHGPALVLQRRQHLDGEAEPRALFLEKGRRTLAAASEMKVIADHGAGDRQPLDQDRSDELLGAQRRERCVERQRERAVQSAGGQQAKLGVFVGQPKQWFLRPEERARVRLEGQRQCGAVERPRAGDGGRDDGPVTAMEPVEIADRRHCARERRRHIGVVAHDAERLRRFCQGHHESLLASDRAARRRPKSSRAPIRKPLIIQRLTGCLAVMIRLLQVVGGARVARAGGAFGPA